jgi:hypothetical protein
MIAPEVEVSTRFDERFQLVREGVTWFGPATTMSILVHPRSGPTPPGDDSGTDPGTEPGGGDAGVDPAEGNSGGGCSAGGDSAPSAMDLLGVGFAWCWLWFARSRRRSSAR